MNGNKIINYYNNLNIKSICLKNLTNNNNEYNSLLLLNDNENISFKTDILKIIDIDIDNNIIILEYVKGTDDFYIFMRNLEKHIKDQVYLNSKKWFGKEIKETVLEQMYESIFIPFEKIPRIRVELNNVNIYDKNNDKMTIKELEINNEIIGIMELKKIVFHPEKFYLKYDIVEIKITNYCSQINNYNFSDSEDDIIKN